MLQNFYNTAQSQEQQQIEEDKRLQLIRQSWKIAQDLFDQRKFQEAFEQFDKFNRQFTNQYKDVFLWKGVCKFQMNQQELAIIQYDQAILLDPYYQEAYFNKGVSLKKLNKLEEAVQQFENVIKINQKKILISSAYANLGFCLQDLNKFQEAIDKFQMAIQMGTTDKYVFYQNAICLQNSDRHEEAIVNFKQALKIDPQFQLAYKFIGISLQILNYSSDAEKYLKQAKLISNINVQDFDDRGVSIDIQEKWRIMSDNRRKQKLIQKPIRY